MSLFDPRGQLCFARALDERRGPIKAFSRLVLGIQKVLAHIRNDWILYFQSEGSEFIVWVYPDKIVITPEFEKNVRNLLQAR